MSAILETIGVLRKGYDEKEAEAAALREALEAIVRGGIPGSWPVEQARAALSADAGREMLERVKKAEAALERIRDKVQGHLDDAGHGLYVGSLDDWRAIRNWAVEGL